MTLHRLRAFRFLPSLRETICRAAGHAGTTLAALPLVLASSRGMAQPLLRCDVSYAGTVHRIEARPVDDPYSVSSIDIAGRFRFKPVLVGSSTQVDRVVLYVYVETRRQPVLVQEAKYLPPFRACDAPVPLTGEQHVYAGPLERELIYSCTLEGIAP